MKNFAHEKHIFIRGLLLALLIVMLDQASKFYLVEILGFSPESRTEILPFFNLVLVHNKGVSFGMGGNLAYAHMFFCLLSIAITLFLACWLYKTEDAAAGLAIGLIIGGATGNIIDRLRLGSVVDFLDFHIEAHHWPAFNLADSAVCIGAFLLLFHGICDKNKVTQI